MSLKRRTLIATAGAAFGAALVHAPAKAAEFELKCGSSQSVDHPSTVRLKQMWAAIERESGGRMHVQFFPNSTLGSESGMLSQLRLGALDFQLCGAGTIPSVVPSANIAFVGFAYKDSAQTLRSIDGALGDYIRAEATAKGVHALHTVWDLGMLQVSSGTHPIRTPDDLHGFKLRVAESRIAVDLFKAFGANPVAVSTAEVYTALQTKVIDGSSSPMVSMESGRLYEVQRSVSITNHQPGTPWLLSNGDLWKRIGPQLQDIVERNNTKYALMERRDNALFGDSVADKFARRGLAVYKVDQTPFRALLGSYYKFWQNEFGPKEWGLLESAVGQKLG